MKIRSLALTAGLVLSATNGFAQTPAANHLVITEMGVYAPTGYSSAPNSAEFTEIYNPTNTTIDLSNYYLSDHPNYFDLPAVVAQQTDNTLTNGSDFLVKFPDGASLPPGGVAVVTNNGTMLIESFFRSDPNEFFGQPGTPQLFEIWDSSPSIPNVGANYNRSAPDYPFDRFGTVVADNGSNMSHTDAGEFTVLFNWDGQGPLVKDVDIVEYRPHADPWDPGSNDFLSDKSAQPGVGPNGQFGNYAFDNGGPEFLDINYPVTGPRGHVYRRSLLEANEAQTGGNGFTGHDETMEIGNLTWEMVIGAPSNGSPGIVDLGMSADNQPPVIGKPVRDVQNPAPGSTVNITVPVYDEGSVTVRLMVDKGSGFTPTTMTSSGNSIYTASISLAGLADKARVKYFVSAEDSAGLTKTETDYQSLEKIDPFYNPFPGYHAFMVKSTGHQATDFIVSEIMYDPLGGNNHHHAQYLELYNPGASPVDLSFCWFGTDDYPGHLVQLPDDVIIPANGYLIIAGNKEVFLRCYPGMNPAQVVDFGMVPSQSFMAHAGSQFQFFDPNVFGFDEAGPADRPAAAFKLFEYSSEAPWPIGAPQGTGAGNTGFPIELTELTAAAETDPAKWAQSLVFNGTPLVANSTNTTLRPGDVAVSNVVRTPQFPSATDAVTITATVASSTAIANVKVYYNSGSGYTPVDMTTTDNANYSAAIGPFADNTKVFYYVEATDTSGGKGAFPYIAPAASTPFVVQNTPVKSGIVINEIMYDNASSDNLQYSEYIELYNANPFPVDLSLYMVGVHLKLNDHTSRLIPDGTVIQPNEYLVLAARKNLLQMLYTSPYTTYFDMEYGEVDLSKVVDLAWQDSSTLSNGDGTTIRLFHPNEVDFWTDADSVPFLELNYMKSAPWPANGTNINAESIELKDPSLDIQNPANWAVSVYFVGTPEARNSVTPPPAAVTDWSVY